MFRYGKKAGVMGAISIVLTIVPIMLVFMYFPQLGDSVPMRVDTAGNVLRWGTKYELLVAPVLCIALTIATFVAGLRQAKRHEDEPSMAVFTFERHMRNAVVQSVVFIVATGIILYGAITGVGIGI